MTETSSTKLQRCDYCGLHVERGDLWVIQGGNGYCSSDCANEHAQHQCDEAADRDRQDAKEDT